MNRDAETVVGLLRSSAGSSEIRDAAAIADLLAALGDNGYDLTAAIAKLNHAD